MYYGFDENKNRVEVLSKAEAEEQNNNLQASINNTDQSLGQAVKDLKDSTQGLKFETDTLKKLAETNQANIAALASRVQSLENYHASH